MSRFADTSRFFSNFFKKWWFASKVYIQKYYWALSHYLSSLLSPRHILLSSRENLFRIGKSQYMRFIIQPASFIHIICIVYPNLVSRCTTFIKFLGKKKLWTSRLTLKMKKEMVNPLMKKKLALGKKLIFICGYIFISQSIFNFVCISICC